MTPAVASGRRVMLLPARSVNVYISFSTMSVVSPTPRENNSVCSKIGKWISLKPKSLITSEAVLMMYAHFHDSGGKMSRVPLGALITAIYEKHSLLKISGYNTRITVSKNFSRLILQGRHLICTSCVYALCM